jgi:hypothetical protein
VTIALTDHDGSTGSQVESSGCSPHSGTILRSLSLKSSVAQPLSLDSVLACFIQGCSQLPPAARRIYHWKDVGALSYSDFLPPIIARRILPGFHSSPFSSEEKRARFENTFATVRKELLDSFAAQGVPEDAQIWYARVRSFGAFFIIRVLIPGPRILTTTCPVVS